jgi:hypothetical protein
MLNNTNASFFAVLLQMIDLIVFCIQHPLLNALSLFTVVLH